MSRWAAALLACAGLLACGKSDGGGGENKPTKRPADTPAAATTDAAAVARPVRLPPAAPIPAPPTGLPATPSPAHNPTTPEKVALGQLLFFDARLSNAGTLSCASCHDPDKGWSDGRALSTNAHDRENLRHTPSLFNVAYAAELYWDGRASTLETCVQANWLGQLAAEPKTVVARLADNRVYAAHFQRSFGGAPTEARVVEALSAFVRTIRSGGSQWDRHEAGDEVAVAVDAVAGAELFRAGAQCALCHPPPLYTDFRYYALAAAAPGANDDPGRFVVTRSEPDRGAFKTPTVRGAMQHAPWLHDGRAGDIDQVIAIHLEANYAGQPIQLSARQRAQLAAFLKALSRRPRPYDRPTLP